MTCLLHIQGSTVDYQQDLWERDGCLGLGQLYGMSIRARGMVVLLVNVRAEPGKSLELKIVTNGKLKMLCWSGKPKKKNQPQEVLFIVRKPCFVTLNY